MHLLRQQTSATSVGNCKWWTMSQIHKYLALFSVLLSINEVFGEYFGLLYSENAQNPDDHSQHCITYNPRFHKLPPAIEEARRIKLNSNLQSSVLCSDDEPAEKFDGDVVAVARGNCTFSEKAAVVQQHGGSAVLVISKVSISTPVANSSRDYQEINITVALIDKNDFEEVMQLGKDIYVQMYAPEPPRFDYNLGLIWLLAVGTVAAGAYWSGTVRHKQLMRKAGRREAQSDREEDEAEPESLDVSPKLIFVCVILITGMLLSLYFLFKYMVYIIISLFAFASSMSLYACLKPLMLKIPCIGACKIPALPLPLLRQPTEVRRLFLGLFCLSVGVFWAVMRNHPLAWILQDILGITFCANMMRTVRLPSLKACTILLVLLFFYDIFFVFVTPLFTKDGQSIMVEVATGGAGGDHASNEMLPMLLKVPRLSHSVLSFCNMPFSLLGFGDILVPGLLVSYCYGFDLRVGSGKIYWVTNVIAYGVGLIITFVALALMEMGQPALLYLVPCTLLTCVVVAAKRGELRLMWNGGKDPDNKAKQEGTSETTDESGARPRMSPVSQRVRNGVEANEHNGDTISVSSQGSDQQLLINK